MNSAQKYYWVYLLQFCDKKIKIVFLSRDVGSVGSKGP